MEDAMHAKRLHQIGANYNDLEETRAFYTVVLGATYLGHYDPPGLLFFNFDGVRVLFERDNNLAVIYVWVDDIDVTYQELLARGVKFEDPPHMIFPDTEGTFGPAGQEEWMVFFKDPGGNTVALATRK
jgi:methylmalonyl-CoA/ethylmalonyl-CoA epimerase